MGILAKLFGKSIKKSGRRRGIQSSSKARSKSSSGGTKVKKTKRKTVRKQIIVTPRTAYIRPTSANVRSFFADGIMDSSMPASSRVRSFLADGILDRSLPTSHDLMNASIDKTLSRSDSERHLMNLPLVGHEFIVTPSKITKRSFRGFNFPNRNPGSRTQSSSHRFTFDSKHEKGKHSKK